MFELYIKECVYKSDLSYIQKLNEAYLNYKDYTTIVLQKCVFCINIYKTTPKSKNMYENIIYLFKFVESIYFLHQYFVNTQHFTSSNDNCLVAVMIHTDCHRALWYINDAQLITYYDKESVSMRAYDALVSKNDTIGYRQVLNMWPTNTRNREQVKGKR